jgi:restriction system protein
MSVEFGLTAEERARMIPSGRAKLMDNRIGWSLTHLSQAGLIERPVRAQVKITPAGLEVVRSHPDRVDVSVLRDYPVYREFRERSRAKQPADSAAVDMRDSGETSSPEDLIDAAVAENRAAVEGEILKKALALSPTGFENLVIALLEAMGYGARRVDPAYERHRRRGHRWRHQPGPTRARPDLYAGQAVCD